MKIEKLVNEYLDEFCKDNVGYEIVDVLFVKEGHNKVLRIFIDKEGGVSIEDCEIVSKYLDKVLDENDPIPEAYTLEVSSPGLDRPLKKDSDYDRFAGRLVDLKLYKAKNGAKKYQGILLGLNNNIIAIENDSGEKIEFSRQEVASVKLAVVF